MLLTYLLVYIATFVGLFFGLFFLISLFEKKTKNPLVPEKKPFVSVVIPAYNEASNLKKCINSVLAIDWPKDKLEIIVIDDGSTDDTYKIAKSIAGKESNVRVLRQKNKGKGTALNLGIRIAKGDFIATLDADSFPTKDVLNHMMGYFSDKEMMIVTPALRISNPKGILGKIQHIEYLMGICMRKAFASLNSVYITPGPFSVFRKSFFEKHGYFDEHNITEDTEIGLRAQIRNCKMENSINAVVYTVAPSSFKSLLNQRIRWYAGLVDNTLRYKQIISKKYGYLGLITLPSAFITTGLLLVLIGNLIYSYLKNIKDTIVNLSLVNFDISPLLKPEFLKLEYIIYQMTNPMFFLFIISIIFTILIILVGKYKSKDRKGIKLDFLYFLILYCILYAFWWVSMLLLKLFGVEIGWGKDIKKPEVFRMHENYRNFRHRKSADFQMLRNDCIYDIKKNGKKNKHI